MTTTIMSQDQINSLNTLAEARIGDGLDEYEAYQAVARDAGLDYVRAHADAGDGGGPQCETYQAEDRSLVNLWIDGSYLGFDDQLPD